MPKTARNARRATGQSSRPANRPANRIALFRLLTPEI
jgi:hypothetical protein